MIEEQCWDIPKINRRPVSIYSMLIEKDGLLLGCGAWDRRKQEHSLEIKNATPGMIVRTDWSGRVVAETPQLGNIVYPLIRSPWSGLFVGCRNGDAYFMDGSLKCQRIGSFGRGVYGIAFSKSLDRLLVGGRNGTLYLLNSAGTITARWPTPANRLWNLCPDVTCDRFVWASSYDGILYKLDALTGDIVLARDLGPGALTLLCWVNDNVLAAGSLKKRIYLLSRSGELVREIPTLGGVCFIGKLPDYQGFYATDYEGRVWIADYQGNVRDLFEKNVERNNPIWIVLPWESRRIICAWASGAISVLRY